MSRATAKSSLPYPELGSETPCTVAAQRVLSDRFGLFTQWFPIATDPDEVDVRSVHQLRVSTRRISAALKVFAEFCDADEFVALKKLLKKIRRAAARARQDDVHLDRFAKDKALRSFEVGRRALLDSIRDSRTIAQKPLNKLGESSAYEKFQTYSDAVLDSIAESAQEIAGISAAAGQQTPYVLTELAACSLPELVEPIRDFASDEHTELEALHDLRLYIKRFRYSLEILGSCFPPEFVRTHYDRVQQTQQRLGSINDLYEITLRIENVRRGIRKQKKSKRSDNGANAENPIDELNGIEDHYRRQLRDEQEQFVDWWQSPPVRATIDAFVALLPTERTRPAVARLPRLTHVVYNPEPVAASPNTAPTSNLHDADAHRIAAIDVGSNSVRMVIAETNAETRFRVIEDIRETTRLAGGLYRTGRLAPEAMDEGIKVLKQMLEHAEQYHVDRLRAIGTSAVREARNGGKFIRRVRDETGIHIEPVSSDYEARLAFASVANAFDLNDLRVAACDLGGGSVDIVIGENGLIERVAGMPLGAVRLTDRFSDAANPGVYRFEKMEKYIDRTLREELAHATPIDLMIGTGGTFTNLARMSIRRGPENNGEGRFPFSVRGYELEYDEVREILAWLRAMSPAARREVPGLGFRRSEIIVAGLCVIERLMSQLNVRRLRVHDGGIRDGLLMEMIDELHLLTSERAPAHGEAMHAVRSFAELCQYPRAHSEHVAKLAIRIFDQLAAWASDRAAAWARPGARDLLEAAGVLHDVGQLIDYRKHHKHSYSMITHADLAPFSRRQIEIIASVARYHRKRGPSIEHDNMKRLTVVDQQLVKDLSGILRIADGLDRLHTQNVQDVILHPRPDCVSFEVVAVSDPTVNIQYANKKSNVFSSAFRTKVEFMDNFAHQRRARSEAHHV